MITKSSHKPQWAAIVFTDGWVFYQLEANPKDEGWPKCTWKWIVLYAPNCLDFWLQAKTVQKNWLKLLSCLQILNLVWTTLWNHLNFLPNGHSGVRMVLDLFWTSKPCKSLQKAPKQNSPLILLQNFGPPIIFWKIQFLEYL